MEDYSRWLDNTPEQQALHILGLFDHPATEAEICAVFGNGTVVGLSDKFRGYGDEKWVEAIKRLSNLQLVSRKEPPTGHLDCHPIVRQYFSDHLRKTNPEAWCEGNSRLCKYYTALPNKDHPDSLEELRPLFYAVRHGCLAGQEENVWANIYIDRIQRGDDFYNTRQLGAISQDLSLLANFFEEPWSVPSRGLPENLHALLLHHVGYDLRELGRLSSATEVLRLSLDFYRKQENWVQATRAAGHLSNLYLRLGNLEQAKDLAKESLDLAEKISDGRKRGSERMKRLAALASALHQLGEPVRAMVLMREAESAQQDLDSDGDHQFLYSLRGFQYCDLLLDEGDVDDVRKRSEWLLQRSIRYQWPFDSALGHLAVAMAIVERAERGFPVELDVAADQISLADSFLVNSDQQSLYVQCLIEKARLCRHLTDLAAMSQALRAATEIVTMTGTLLQQVDIYLLWAEFHLQRGENAAAKNALAVADGLIGTTHYYRRDPDRVSLAIRLQVPYDSVVSAGKRGSASRWEYPHRTISKEQGTEPRDKSR